MTICANLVTLLDAEIARFDKESNKHKSIHRRSQGTLIACSAISSVIAGSGLLFPDSGRQIQFLVLVTTTLTTSVAVWVEMRRARDLWQHEREVYYALTDIKREVEFVDSIRPLNESEVESYFQRMNRTLGSSGQKWARIQAQKQS